MILFAELNPGDKFIAGPYNLMKLAWEIDYSPMGVFQETSVANAVSLGGGLMWVDPLSEVIKIEV